MKKIFAILLTLVMVIGLFAGCGGGHDHDPTTEPTEVTVDPTYGDNSNPTIDATDAPTEAPTETPTEVPETEAPTEAPTEPEDEDCVHNYKSETVKPTCTSAGYTKKTCTKCGYSFKTDAVKATGHDYKKTVVAPTKTAQGYTLYECKNCDYSYKDNYTDKLPSDNTTEPVHQHSYKSKVTAPTCTAKGYTTYTCSCGDSYKGNETPATGHSYSSKVTKAATCSAKGVKTYTCKNCSHSYTENIAKTAHDYKSTVIAPTCTAKGYTQHKCSVCGDTYKGTEKAALGHDWNNGKVTKAATCTAEGVKTYTCKRNGCGKTKTEAIAKVAHKYKTTTVAPTTTSQGYDLHTCSVCGHSYKDNYTDKLPAETEPPHTHSYGKTVTAPTCESKGYTTYTCSCGDSYKADETAALGHSWGDWVVTKEATVDAEGEETRTCQRNGCGKTETRKTDKLPDDGGSCTEHNWGSWTSDDNGSYRSCSKCGEQQVIDGSTSSYSQEVVNIINQYRAAEGLDPVTNFTWKIMLVRAHELTVCFSHSRPDGSYGYDTCIAAGYGSAQTAVDAWMNSSSHRGSLMNPNATEACAAYNGSYWVLYIG